MIFYHFTDVSHLPSILAKGLTRGRVPLSPFTGDDATGLISLTTEASGAGSSLIRRDDCPRPLKAEERAEIALDTGVELAAGAILGDSTGSRITIRIPASDRRLVRWSKFVRKRIDPDWLAWLEREPHRPDTWWMYHGKIAPESFLAVEQRRGDVYAQLGSAKYGINPNTVARSGG